MHIKANGPFRFYIPFYMDFIYIQFNLLFEDLQMVQQDRRNLSLLSVQEDQQYHGIQ